MSSYSQVRTQVAADPVVVHVVNPSGPRSAYWWEAGPVDTCCCCFSLRTGVGILAVLDFLSPGIWMTISLITKSKEAFEFLLDNSKDMYASECEGTRTTSEERCVQLAESIGQLQQDVDNISVPTILYVRVALSMIAGGIGLWAFFGSNVTAAKVYLYTWPLRYLVAILSMLVSYGSLIRKSPPLQLVEVIRLICFLYYLKVVWSYKEVLKRRTQSTESFGPPSDAAGDMELNSLSAGDRGASRDLV